MGIPFLYDIDATIINATKIQMKDANGVEGIVLEHEGLIYEDETEDTGSDYYGVKYKLIIEDGEAFLEVVSI